MLLVDEREGSKELIPILPDELTSTFAGEGSTADVVLTGNGPTGPILVGVEVKKISDLLSSESTGRLAATQLPSLLEADLYREVWLLTIGDYRAGPGGRLEVWKPVKGVGRWVPYVVGGRAVPYAYLESFLVEIQAMGVHLKQVTDERMAACWLVVCHNWWDKPWDKHKAMRKIDRSHELGLMPTMDPNTKQMVKIAHQLPSIGYERAYLAAQHFANSRAMANASSKDWARIPGIGPVIASGVEAAWKGEL